MHLSWSDGTKQKLAVITLSIFTALIFGRILLFTRSQQQAPLQISYPNDIIEQTQAPLYQHEFILQDAIFSSKFESGNLKSASQVSENTYRLEVGEDCNNVTRFNNKNWFYFSIKNTKKTRLIRVQIENMAYNWSMWKNGIAPVYRSNYTTWRWAFLDHFPLKMWLKKNNLQVEFKYRLRENEKVYIALSFPWTYTMDRAFYSKLEQKFVNDEDIYFEKEILAKSMQGRRVQMVTITNRQRKLKQIQRFPQIGKNPKLFLGRKQSNTQFFPNKKYIVISARVHPSEVASSYVLRAFTNYILNKRKTYAKNLLESFVIVIIPMLNPDGVVNGYTRLDTNGFNLNARFKFTNEKTPSIYALKKLIGHLSSKGVLHSYIDLHSHTTKRGIFFFANPLTDSNFNETLEIPYLFYLFHKKFTFSGSRFGVEKGESTSRKEFYKMTKCNRLYVLETNYWGASQPFKLLKENNLVRDNLRIVKNFGRFYNLPKFTEIGENLAKSIIKAGELEMFRMLNLYSPYLREINKNIRRLFKKLTIKSKKRRGKKIKSELRSQIRRFKAGTIGSTEQNMQAHESAAESEVESESPSAKRAILGSQEETDEPNHSDGVEDSNHEEVFKGQEIDYLATRSTEKLEHAAEPEHGVDLQPS